MNYWLVKSDSDVYDWDALKKEKSTAWTGIRNYAARLHLLAMKKGDAVLFYHSGALKEIVGIAKVSKENYLDPTATEGEWCCVDLKAERDLKSPVSLAAIKKEGSMKDFPLIRISRLSVMPVSEIEFEKILKLAGEK